MIEQIPWTQRTFTFDQPVGLLPCTIERLRGVPARLTLIVAHYSEQHLGSRPAPESWSVKEHIGHLHDLDHIHDGRLDDYLAGMDMLRPADILNKVTFENDYNSRNVAEILGLFAKRRMAFIRRLAAFSAEDASRSSVHPRLKIPMRLADMALFCAEHDEHHMAKIAVMLNLH